MSKFSEQLRSLKIFNNFELLTKFGVSGDVAIEYHRPAPGRLGWCERPHTSVWSPIRHQKLERIKPLSHTAGKEFNGLRAQSFSTALAWAKENFGYECVPSPFGGQIPKHVCDKAWAFVREHEIKEINELQIDHIDGDPKNNDPTNLRLATPLHSFGVSSKPR